MKKPFFILCVIIAIIAASFAAPCFYVLTQDTIPREYQINYTIGNQKVTYVTKAYFMIDDNSIEFRDEHGIKHQVSGTFEIVYIK